MRPQNVTRQHCVSGILSVCRVRRFLFTTLFGLQTGGKLFTAVKRNHGGRADPQKHT